MSDSALRRLREKVDHIVQMEREFVPQVGLRGEPLVEDIVVRLHASIWAEAVIAAYSLTEVVPEPQKTL